MMTRVSSCGYFVVSESGPYTQPFFSHWATVSSILDRPWHKCLHTMQLCSWQNQYLWVGHKLYENGSTNNADDTYTYQKQVKQDLSTFIRRNRLSKYVLWLILLLMLADERLDSCTASCSKQYTLEKDQMECLQPCEHPYPLSLFSLSLRNYIADTLYHTPCTGWYMQDHIRTIMV